jgi:outer membrane protein TolC
MGGAALLLAVLLAAGGAGRGPLVLGAELPLDVSTALSLAAARGGALEALEARADAEARMLSLAQPSRAPVLRAGARAWPFAGSAGAAAEPDRYRWFAQLRFPLTTAVTSRAGDAFVAAARTRDREAAGLARASLAREVATSFVAARLATESAPAYAGLIAAQHERLRIERVRLGSASSTAADVARAEQTLATTLAMRDDAAAAGELAAEHLAALTGAPDVGALAPIERVPLAASAAEASELARQSRPEPRLLRAEAARYRAEGSLAWRRLADVDVGIAYQQGRSDVLDEPGGLAALVEISIPLDSWRRVRDRLDASAALARAAELEAFEAEARVATEARDAFTAHERALAHLSVARAGLERARAIAEQVEGRASLVLDAAQGATLLDVTAAKVRVEEAALALVEGAARAELAYVSLALAVGRDLSAPGERGRALPANDSPSGAVRAAPRNGLSRGVWVWRTRELLRRDDAGGMLRAFCERLGIGEVYLSTPEGVLDDERLSPVVAALGAAGIRVEALVGNADWFRTERHGEVRRRVEEIASYNALHPTARFAAVHLDVEPHQLAEIKRGEPLGYLPEFTEMLRVARDASERGGMSLSVDVPRKLLQASPAEARRLAERCPRVSFMLYVGAPPDGDRAAKLLAWSREAVDWCDAAGCEAVIGARWSDHGEQTPALLRSVEEALTDHPGFGGWAIHDYAGARHALDGATDALDARRARPDGPGRTD